MVKRLCFKKCSWLAITFFVIANLFWPNFSFADSFKVTAKDTERIKSSLTVTQTTLQAIDLFGSNKDLMTILNTIVGAGKTGTDITYGLVVLGTLNEMDLVDLVVSGRYRDDAREYFNSVLDQTTDMIPHWKNTVQDIVSLLKKGKAVTPTTGLAMESVVILEKTMNIMIATRNWLTVKTYNGMWRYFQERMGKESHREAWAYAIVEMGHAHDVMVTNNELFVVGNKYLQEEDIQLEQQFLTLYETWEPYVTPFGISEEYKKQVKEDLSNTLVAALKSNTVADEKFKPSLVDKLYNQLEKLKKTTADLLAEINPFKAGVALNLPPEELIEVRPQSMETEPLEEADIVEQNIPEEIIEPEVEEIIATTTFPEVLASTTEPVLEPEPEPVLKLEPLPAPIIEPTPIADPVFCKRDSGNPARFRILINEVAWMGTTNSTDDEWIELKNIWGIPVNLNGWQLLDKDRQIKIIFEEGDIIPAGGYYLLERTDDSSMPDAEANLIYTGALSNTNEALYLFDAECNIEDEVLANPSWPAGDNSLKKPMARLDALDWYAGISTPGSENSSPPVSHSTATIPIPTVTPSPASPQIFITETYIGSADNQKDDFVELYNPGADAIDLTDYYIQRKTETAQDFSTYISHELLTGKIIAARNYFLIANASSTFATSADVITDYPLTENNTLVLKASEQEIVDRVSTGNPTSGKSYGRKWSNTTLNYTEDFEAQAPTPRAQNQNSEPVEENEEEENNLLSVVINEIAWAGTNAYAVDEWIEFYNNTTSTIDLAGWRLISSDGTPDIIFPTSTLAANDFYLIERTDDDTIKDIAADLIYTGALENAGEKLELLDSNGNLIDTVDCSAGWFTDDNQTKQTMERINPLATGSDSDNWASNNLITKNGLDANGDSINGTPKTENSVTKNYTALSGGITFSENFTLKRLGSPYISDGPIHILSGATLSIEPGVVIKLKHGSSRTPYAELKVEGSLSAVGSESQKIVFTSLYDDEYGGDTNNDGDATQPAAGDWDWVYFKDSASILQNVIVKYGGKLHSSCCGEFPSYTYGAIYVDGGQLTISSSTVEKSATLGLWIKDSINSIITSSKFEGINTSWSKPAAIYIENGSSTISNSTFQDNNICILAENFAAPNIENNTFTSNQTPIQINTLLPTIIDNTFNDNTYNGIYLTDIAVPEGQTSITWRKTNAPYIVNSLTLASELTLQIEPGVIINFLSNGGLNLQGCLKANGTADEKIIFASNQSTAGSWHSIYFAASSAGSILENIIIRYGGWYNVPLGGANAKGGAVKTESTSLAIKNSLFENNLFAGLQIINATTTIENVAFNKNEHGIYIESDANECPNLSGAIFGEGENANSIKVFPSSCAP